VGHLRPTDEPASPTGLTGAGAAPIHRVLVPEPRPTSDVPYHHERAPAGQKYLILDRSVVPGSPFSVVLRRIDHVPADDPPRWLDPHEHDCNSFYVFLGDEPDLTGLHAVATIGDLTFPVASPAAVLIPPRALHHYWYTSGRGWYFQVTLKPDYVSSLVPAEEWGRAPPSPRLAGVHQPARPAPGGWRLVDDVMFDAPGLRLEAVDLDAPERPTAAVAADRVSLDVVIGRGGARPTFRLACHGHDADGGTPVAAPCSVLHVGGTARIRPVAGAGLIVRLVPDAPFDRGAG
jgi:2-isopropylmalate synthase